MIIDDIKKANIVALKEKNQNARNIYSIIMNKHQLLLVEARATGKELTDADMVKIITKTIKELTEEAENYKKVNNTEKEANINEQKAILEKYLPKMMTEDEIRKIILSLDDKSVPNVMRYFKTNHNGTCDMKTVSDVLKSL